MFALPGGTQTGASPPSTLAVSQIGKYLNRRVGPSRQGSYSPKLMCCQNAATWRVIRELQARGSCSELDAMTDEQRAVLRLSRVHGIGSNYAKTL